MARSRRSRSSRRTRRRSLSSRRRRAGNPVVAKAALPALLAAAHFMTKKGSWKKSKRGGRTNRTRRISTLAEILGIKFPSATKVCVL